MGAALYGLLRTFMCSLQQFSLEVKSVLYFSHLISDISEVHSVFFWSSPSKIWCSVFTMGCVYASIYYTIQSPPIKCELFQDVTQNICHSCVCRC